MTENVQYEEINFFVLSYRKQYVLKDTTASIVLANVHVRTINSFVMLLTVAYADKVSPVKTAVNRNTMLKNK